MPGLRSIYVWRQEDYQDIHFLLMRILLRWKTGPKLDVEQVRVNESLSKAAVRQILAWGQGGETHFTPQDAREQFPIGATNPRFELYARSTLAESDAIYADQCARIAQIEGVTLLNAEQLRAKG